jgi:hypothetical protein
MAANALAVRVTMAGGGNAPEPSALRFARLLRR